MRRKESKKDIRQALACFSEEQLREIYLKLQERYGSSYAPPYEMKDRYDVETRLMDALRMTGECVIHVLVSNPTHFCPTRGRVVESHYGDGLLRSQKYRDGMLASDWLDICYETLGSTREHSYTQLLADNRRKQIELVHV
jgi:hypothetical protein